MLIALERESRLERALARMSIGRETDPPRLQTCSAVIGQSLPGACPDPTRAVAHPSFHRTRPCVKFQKALVSRHLYVAQVSVLSKILQEFSDKTCYSFEYRKI